MTEALIRQRIEDWAKAIRAKDIDGSCPSMHPTSFHSISIHPCGYAGTDNKRRAWQKFFAAYTGPIAYEVRELERHDARRVGFRSQPQPRKRHTGERSHGRPVGALDGVLPANRWRLAGRARSRVSPGRPRAWPGCS